MKVELGIIEIERYLKSLQTQNIAKGETNAFRYFDIGRQKAIEEVLNLLALFHENFIDYLPEIYRNYSKALSPLDDGDRCNADTYLLDGYKDIINKFIQIK